MHGKHRQVAPAFTEILGASVIAPPGLDTDRFGTFTGEIPRKCTPVVLAQWINSQHYFSAVDREVFGAGTKTIHNVVGGIGVPAGHNGDLQLGLP